MKIESAHVAVSADRSRTLSQQAQLAAASAVPVAATGQIPQEAIAPAPARAVQFSPSEDLRSRLNSSHIQARAHRAARVDSQMELLKQLIEMFIGKRIEGVTAKPNAPRMAEDASAESDTIDAAAAAPAMEGDPAAASDGASFDASSTYSESTHISLNATGVIVTDAGERLDFSFTLELSREYLDHHELHVQNLGDPSQGQPLTISFAGEASQLESTAFSFDINNQGTFDVQPALDAAAEDAMNATPVDDFAVMETLLRGLLAPLSQDASPAAAPTKQDAAASRSSDAAPSAAPSRAASNFDHDVAKLLLDAQHDLLDTLHSLGQALRRPAAGGLAPLQQGVA